MSFWSAFSSAQKQQSPPQQEGKFTLVYVNASPTAHSPARRVTCLLLCCCAAAPPAPTPAVQAAQSKPMSVGHASVAHPQHHEGATDLDLYRTFSPTEVGMWSWEATTGGVLLQQTLRRTHMMELSLVLARLCNAIPGSLFHFLHRLPSLLQKQRRKFMPGATVKLRLQHVHKHRVEGSSDVRLSR